MWQLSHPILKTASLNLVELGQGKADVAQFWQDDVRLINVIGRVNWQDPVYLKPGYVVRPAAAAR